MTKASGIMLAPMSALYGATMRARLALYRAGALTVHKIPAPVISVGNITAGGTGKTPLVEWIARRVASEGRRVCILTRGYKRADESKRVLVSDGERILADASVGGDEPRMLSESLRGVAAVVSDADRVAAARWAIGNLGSRVFILDDGFQHLRLARNLDIVTLDATNPFGGGALLPRGLLRESVRNLSRADCIIITRAEQSQDAQELREEARRLSGNRPVLLSQVRTKLLRPLQENEMAQSASRIEQPVAAFCATGNPRAFFHHVQTDGHTIAATRAFPDHHNYTQADIISIEGEAKASGAQALITTAKDAVKLRALQFTVPCFVFEVEIELEDEEVLLALILNAIKEPE